MTPELIPMLLHVAAVAAALWLGIAIGRRYPAKTKPAPFVGEQIDHHPILCVARPRNPYQKPLPESADAD